jgi:tetratricopeptide (TPR) repeat protein
MANAGRSVSLRYLGEDVGGPGVWRRLAARRAMDSKTARRQLLLSKEAELGLNGPESEAWLRRLDDSHDDREQAFAWYLERDRQQGLEMAAALLAYWNTRGLYEEGRRWSDALLSRAPERTLARARALYGAGVMAFRQGDTERTRLLTEESLAIARELADPRAVVTALAGLGRVGLREGDYERVKELNREGLEIAQQQGDPALRRLPLHLLAEATRLGGDYPGARALYQESLALNRVLGNEYMIRTELSNLGAVELHEGNLDAARAHWEEAARLCHSAGDAYGLPYAIAGLGELAAARADWERAATLLAATESLFQASGAVMDPADVPPYESAVTATRSALGEPFGTAWARGSSLDRDEAVRTALGERVSA